ncbi:MAG TPA: isopentenyl phosphate kinase [Thermoplasmata archaeon]|nr:isopentenyl phosphate kinase [Thermoplasmata archaeon]
MAVRPPETAALLPIVVVKLGGSVITRKREIEKLRAKVLARLAGELASITDRRLIVLHGAGGFGHRTAARFGLNRPPAPGVAPRERARGAAIVSAEVRRLHLAVLRALVEAGASPWSIPIAHHVLQHEGRVERVDLAPFAATLARGHMPVSFGDVVPDSAWGFSILSADTIALEIARAIHPERVVFVSDVEGILGPIDGGRRAVLPAITAESIATLAPPSGAPDVTGGIRAKSNVALQIAEAGSDAGIISGLRDGALSGAIHTNVYYGSWARAAGR